MITCCLLKRGRQVLEFFTKILLIEKTEKKLRKCKSSYSDGYNGWLTSVD